MLIKYDIVRIENNASKAIKNEYEHQQGKASLTEGILL
jgi:hypothetical protein